MGDMVCPGLEPNETLGNYQKRVLELFNKKQIDLGDPDGSDKIHTLREAIARGANNIEILNTNLAKLTNLNIFFNNKKFPRSRGQEDFISEYNNKLDELNVIAQAQLNIEALVSGAENNDQIVKGNLDKINTIIRELLEKYGKESDALNVQQSQNNETLKAKENDLREFIKQCALAEKERNRDPDKLSPAAANNNRLLIAALPYVALNKIWAPCPELFDQYLSGKEKIEKGDLTPHSYKTLCGLLMNICLAYVVKYTKKSRQEEQVPGYAELFKPHADTIMKALPVISDVDIEESFSNFNERGQYLGEVLANKTSDVERAVLASTLYSLPTMVYTVYPRTVNPREDVLPSEKAIEFNNATVKPRFLQQSLGQDEMYVNYCDSAARLLDMGGDGCRTAPREFPQEYEFNIDAGKMQNRTRLDFSSDGENYSINMAFGESGRVLNPGSAIGDFKDYGFRYGINDTKSVTKIGNMFSKRGAAQQMADAFIGGLNSIRTKANLNNVTTRYNLFLRNPTWVNPLLTGAAHKMFGDLCRDTLELFTKFTFGTNTQINDAILANNDRPAQAMATYMAAALTDANNSGSCWATDTSGKTPDQVMAVWGVRGEPSWTTEDKLNQTSIVFGIKAFPGPGKPPLNAYKDVVPILMAALDGIHDFVPSSTFMEKLASSFSEAKSGGGKVKKQKGGAPDYDPSNPIVFEKDRLLDELNEYAEVNSIMIAIDQALAVKQGFMELNEINVGGRATSFYGYNNTDIDTLFIVERADDDDYISQERLFIKNFKAIADKHSIGVEGVTIIVPFPDANDTIEMSPEHFQDLLLDHMNENADYSINELLPQTKLEECFALYQNTHYRIKETLKVTEINEDFLLQILGIKVTVPERVVKGMGQPTGDPFVDRTMEEAAAARADEEWMKQHAVLVEAARESLKTPAFKSYTDSQRKRLHYSDDDDEDDNVRRTLSVPKIARYDAGYEPIRTQSAPDPLFPPTPPESQEDYGASAPAPNIMREALARGLRWDPHQQNFVPVVGGGKRRTMKNKSKSKRNAKNQTHRKRKGKAVGKRTATAHRPKTARNAKKITKKSTSNTKTKRSAKPAKKRAINRRARNARKDRK